jgi:UDPglucose--hexose-1-phosphate uridylyltransferase
MAELRQDIITGQWVVVATERAMRPTDFSSPNAATPQRDDSSCPFCPGHELMTPLEVLAVRPEGSEPNSSGWQVRVFPNKYAAFETGEDVAPGTEMYPRRPAEGSHEVIVHSPDHVGSLATMPPEEVELVFRVYRHRYRANCEDPQVRYVHIVVNHGRQAGASLEHSHSQLFGVPLVPTMVMQEMAGASWHYSRRSQCVFCRMISEELLAQQRVIARNREFVALAPFASRFPFEVWILPRSHQESYDLINEEQLDELSRIVHDVLGKYHQKFNDPPYNFYIHSAPCDGSEYPYFHWHLEILPRLTTLGAFELGTSMMINVTTPESAADLLTGRSDSSLGMPQNMH